MKSEVTIALGELQKFSLMAVVVFTLTMAPAHGFLGRGTLLETQGDVFGIYCSDFDKNTRVWHHREITREAVRRSVVRYFKEIAPAEGVYNHRDGMTLEEIFAEYYGRRRSPHPFLDAVAHLADAAAEADSGIFGDDPRYHFGSERFSESQQRLASRWRRIVHAGEAGDYRAALYMLGISLAAIQDFYSHTNWIELGNKKFNRDVGIPGKDFPNVATPLEETCRDCPLTENKIGACVDNLLKGVLEAEKLTSGYADDALVNGIRIGKPSGIGKCSHGGSRDRSRRSGTRGGLNKELPTACFSPHHQLHQEAAEQAVQASEYYINLLRGVLGDALFTRMLGLYPTPALVIVLDTTDSMDEELTALRHVVSRLVKQHSSTVYPPAEYILVPFNDPNYGPVTRSQHPDKIHEALLRLRAVGGGDESEFSMSALRLALHCAPPHSHVYLFTDASIKDAEYFDTVIAMAHSKNVKVTPVLTRSVLYGGTNSRRLPLAERFIQPRMDSNIISKVVSESHRRTKRQLHSIGKYTELAERTGSQVIETPGDMVEQTATVLETDQYPMAVLWRKSRVTSPQEVKIEVDSLIEELEVSLGGGVSSATLLSPSGVTFDLLQRDGSADKAGYSVVVSTPHFIQVRLNLTERQNDFGEWTFRFEPQYVTSAVVNARSTMDILPSFYTPDRHSSRPSMQRVTGQPGKGLETYLDIVISGVDTAKLRRVDGVKLLDSSGSEVLKLEPPFTSPRRNTYIGLPTSKLSSHRFSVALFGEDGTGRRFRRESEAIWEVAESVMSFPLGREIWGSPGDTPVFNVTISNTNPNTATSPTTFFVNAYDTLGFFPVILNNKKLNVGANETVSFPVVVRIPRNATPHSTNTIVVTATSNHGDTTHGQAHLSVSPRVYDRTPPECRILTKTSCSGYHYSNCQSRYWETSVKLTDYDSGIFTVSSSPRYSFPLFNSGIAELQVTYRALCCDPYVQITVYDGSKNMAVCDIDNSDLGGQARLSTGAIAGISVGVIAALALLGLVVVLLVMRRRRQGSENVTERRARRRSSNE